MNFRINIEWEEIKRIIIVAATEAEEQKLQIWSNDIATAVRELRLQKARGRDK
jgi:hypothetical protein